MNSSLPFIFGGLKPLKPVRVFSPEVLRQAAAVKVVFFDVDGVFTDGGLYFSEYPDGHRLAVTPHRFAASGEMLKRFNTLDGQGMKLLQKAGITPAVITGRDSAVLRARLAALGIVHSYFGTEDKRPAAESVLQNLGLNWTAAAAMGDDWPDLPVMRRAAFSAAPANAHVEVQAVADWVTQAHGGHGAVRELCDLLLQASGHYGALLEAFAQ